MLNSDDVPLGSKLAEDTQMPEVQASIETSVKDGEPSRALSRNVSPSPTPGEVMSTPIEIFSGSGDQIGQLQVVAGDNYLLGRVVERPVKRPVQIRPGRKFTVSDLEAVPYPESSDARGFKLLTFYIQATGEVQEHPCTDCAQNHGLYQGCVMIDDEDFPRCGNCEWNRRRCHGASLNSSSWSVQGRLRSSKTPTQTTAKARPSGASFTPGSGEKKSKPAGSKKRKGPHATPEATPRKKRAFGGTRAVADQGRP